MVSYLNRITPEPATSRQIRSASLAAVIWFGNPRFIDSKISDLRLCENAGTNGHATAHRMKPRMARMGTYKKHARNPWSKNPPPAPSPSHQRRTISVERWNSATPGPGLKPTRDFPANPRRFPALAAVIWFGHIIVSPSTNKENVTAQQAA